MMDTGVQRRLVRDGHDRRILGDALSLSGESRVQQAVLRMARRTRASRDPVGIIVRGDRQQCTPLVLHDFVETLLDGCRRQRSLEHLSDIGRSTHSRTALVLWKGYSNDVG